MCERTLSPYRKGIAVNLVVTGGAGFIGSHLCEALLRRGDRCVAIDNFDAFYDRAMKEENVAIARTFPSFSFVEGDICSPADLDRAFQLAAPVDVVVHLAALAGVRPSLLQPARYQEVNVGGTTAVLEAMRRHQVQKLVFASSSSVYGNHPKVPFAEEDRVDFPISPYAATKRACELIAYTYHHLFGMSIFCLRFFTVYGPRQRPDLAIHKFARLLAEGRPIPVYGDGSTSRDYTYIDDILEGVLAAIDRVSGYRIYNLGESETIPLRDLIRLLSEAMGITPQIQYEPPQPGDVVCTYADITRAREELGYAPRIKIAEGIARFVAWFREHHVRLSRRKET